MPTLPWEPPRTKHPEIELVPAWVRSELRPFLQTTKQSHPHSVQVESDTALPIGYRGDTSNPDPLDLIEVDLV